MFKAKINFKWVKRNKIVVDNYKLGLISNESFIWNNKNSLYTAENIDYTDKMGFKKRPTIELLWTNETTWLVSWIWFNPIAISTANYFRCKNADFQRLVWSTWTNTWTIANISNVWSYWDIIPFRSIWSAESWTWSSWNATAWDKRYITNIWWMTINDFIWKYIVINWETKLITSNTEDRIYIYWEFDKIPTTEAYVIYESTNAMYIIWEQDLYKYDAVNWFTDLTSVSITPLRWVVEHNRLWYVSLSWDTPYIHFSDLGVWDYFPKNNFIKLQNLGTPTCIKNIQWKIVIYFATARVDITWDSPDNFSVNYVFTHKGAVSWWSVANGNNMQFFLSNEWIEMLNAIDNSSVKEWLSLSDGLEFHTNTITRAHGVVSNDKYYLGITSVVYIYDIEKSFQMGNSVFATAKYTEASQTGSPVAWEWTCAKDCGWIATFWQGWNVYQIMDWVEDDDITVTIETWRLNLGDEKVKKIHQRVKMSFVPCAKDTTFKLYVSIEWWAYSLVKTTTEFEFEAFLSNIWRDIQLKLEITQSGAWAWFYEFLWSEIYFTPIYNY